MTEEMTKTVEKDQFAKLLGMELIKVDIGYAEVRMAIKAEHFNGLGIVQGGVIFTLADFAFAAASNAGGKASVSVNANITYFKPAKGETLLAKASEITSSRSLCNYTVDIFDEDNAVLIAKFNATGFIKN